MTFFSNGFHLQPASERFCASAAQEVFCCNHYATGNHVPFSATIVNCQERCSHFPEGQAQFGITSAGQKGFPDCQDHTSRCPGSETSAAGQHPQGIHLRIRSKPCSAFLISDTLCVSPFGALSVPHFVCLSSVSNV